MKKIEITYVGSEQIEYIWVRPIPAPETGGHKALKNEDFIDHQDLINRNSYYKQVVEKRLAARYLERVSQRLPEAEAERNWNQQAGINRRIAIAPVKDEPLRRIPTVKD